MRILVTGAGGFVGKRLVARLVAAGHEVVALVRGSPALQDAHFFAGASLLKHDLTQFDPGAMPAGVNALLTLAQSSRFRDFPAEAEEVFAVNVTAHLKLLQWAVNSGVRRSVHVSSGGIYGGRQGARFQEVDLLAVDSPLGFYLGTKLCSEVVFQNYRHYFDSAVILRPFFIYGPGQRKDMFVARIIDAVLTGKPVTLQGRDGLRINPVYVDDAATAFARALEVRGSHIFNVAGPDVVTLRELAETVGRLSGRMPVFAADETAQPVDYVGTTTLASWHLGQAATALREGLALALGEPEGGLSGPA